MSERDIVVEPWDEVRWSPEASERDALRRSARALRAPASAHPRDDRWEYPIVSALLPLIYAELGWFEAAVTSPPPDGQPRRFFAIAVAEAEPVIEARLIETIERLRAAVGYAFDDALSLATDAIDAALLPDGEVERAAFIAARFRAMEEK